MEKDGLDSDYEEVVDDEVDPRVKYELDTLNQSTDEINKLETEMTEEREKFKASLNDATQRLEKLTKKYGKAIDRARPYYDTKAQVNQAQSALQRAVSNFQRAIGVHRAAKETIALAEDRLKDFSDKKVDMAWQEMLNLQTARFMEAERDRHRSEKLHQQSAKRYEFLERKLNSIAKKHKRSTKKTKPYFELKDMLELSLQKKRHKLDDLQRSLDEAKKRYRDALNNLEKISTEIHEKRRNQMKESMLTLREKAEGTESVIDGSIFQNTMNLDLIGPKTYDDIDELESELANFEFEDYPDGNDNESCSSDAEDSDDSVFLFNERPGHPFKRTNSMPEGKRQHRKTKSYRRQNSLSPAGSVRYVSLDEGSSPHPRVRRKLLRVKSGAFEEASDEYSNKESKISPIKEDITENENSEDSHFRGISVPISEMNDVTYRRLHGTNVTAGTKAKDKKERKNSSDVDIFDELC